MLSRGQLQTSTRARLAAILGTLSLGLALGSCAKGEFATISGAGAAFPQAQYQVLGRTKYDQTWIDRTTEAEVAGFGFKRPLRRPASLDASGNHAAPQRRVVAPPVASGVSIAQPGAPADVTVSRPVKKTLRQRLDDLNEKVRKLEGKP